MTEDELSRELIGAFRGGATVAELVRLALRRVGEDDRRRWRQAVYRAFKIGPSGWGSLGSTESFGNGTMPDSVLTWVFLPDILANRPAWDTDPDHEPAWFDGVEKTPLDEQEKLAATSHGLSPEGWAALGERDREQVIFLEKMRLHLGENVQLLAALAERLQRRVNELEQQPAPVGGTTEQ